MMSTIEETNKLEVAQEIKEYAKYFRDTLLNSIKCDYHEGILTYDLLNQLEQNKNERLGLAIDYALETTEIDLDTLEEQDLFEKDLRYACEEMYSELIKNKKELNNKVTAIIHRRWEIGTVFTPKEKTSVIDAIDWLITQAGDTADGLPRSLTEWIAVLCKGDVDVNTVEKMV